MHKKITLVKDLNFDDTPEFQGSLYINDYYLDIIFTQIKNGITHGIDFGWTYDKIIAASISSCKKTPNRIAVCGEDWFVIKCGNVGYVREYVNSYIGFRCLFTQEFSLAQKYDLGTAKNVALALKTSPSQIILVT